MEISFLGKQLVSPWKSAEDNFFLENYNFQARRNTLVVKDKTPQMEFKIQKGS